MQSDLTEPGLAHLLADAGKLDVEGVKSEEVVAASAGSEQGARIAVGIALASDLADRDLAFALIQGFPVLVPDPEKLWDFSDKIMRQERPGALGSSARCGAGGFCLRGRGGRAALAPDAQ